MSKFEDLLCPDGPCAIAGCEQDAVLVVIWITPVGTHRAFLKDGYCDPHGRRLMNVQRDFKKTAESS